ncbi:MAG: DUF420 domain-containing protein [Elusimicrobia bacterium]|nr:DUF420 domain-containing protein [Elusimicrobiota bacterium]
MRLSALPGLNACLNAGSAVLLLLGWYFIRARKVEAHRLCMLAALACSTFFLSSYLYYHAHVGSVPFHGQGMLRKLYFTILVSHTILAAVIVPMILRALYLALKGRFVEHSRWAKRVLPLWLYVSVTGVVIYLMLYRLQA